MSRRSRMDYMEPINAITWLVVADKYGRSLKIIQLEPLTDPRMAMIQQMAKSIGMGFEVEELPGTMPLYFARRGDPNAASFERNCVTISRRHPDVSLDRGCEPVGASATVMPLKPR